MMSVVPTVLTRFGSLLAALGLLALPFSPAFAQSTAYPNKPVKIVVAFPAGGLLDTVSRIVGDKMAGILGQQFLVESRPGAGGTIATQSVARAEPDGYTLMMINDNHSINPSVFKNIPYDSIRDFVPIGFVGYAPLVLAVNAGIPARTVKELVELARQKPGTISYGSVGIGSASHLAGEKFTANAGIKMLHVPYRGGAPALNDLVAGHLNTMFLSAVIGLQQMNAGKLAPLAIAAKERFVMLPNVPTMAEAGFPFEVAYWMGLVAPAATPPAVVAQLEKALAQTLAMDDVKKRLTEMGAVVTSLNSKQFGEFIKSEMVNWADVVAKANVKIE